MKIDLLTSSEIEEELVIEKQRIAYLDAKLASLSPETRHQLMSQLIKTANNACQMAVQRLLQWKIIDPIKTPNTVGLIIMSSSHPEAIRNQGRLVSGLAYPNDNVIGILDHLALAPKEVARNIAGHECLHLLYPLRVNNNARPKQVRIEIKADYPEDLQEEEEWVRRLESTIFGNGISLELWESAVETHGNNWRTAYKILKKKFYTHNRRSHF